MSDICLSEWSSRNVTCICVFPLIDADGWMVVKDLVAARGHQPSSRNGACSRWILEDQASHPGGHLGTEEQWWRYSRRLMLTNYFLFVRCDLSHVTAATEMLMECLRQEWRMDLLMEVNLSIYPSIHHFKLIISSPNAILTSDRCVQLSLGLTTVLCVNLLSSFELCCMMFSVVRHRRLVGKLLQIVTCALLPLEQRMCE